MTLQAIMPGPSGQDVTAYKRSARQVRAGDYLPDYSAHAVTDAIEDPDETRAVWVTLEDGRDVKLTTRKVWLFRRYELADWQRDAVTAYRDARDARNALRETGAAITASAAGTAGASVGAYQLSDEEFSEAFPAPRLADFLKDAAAARREPERV